MIYSIFIRVVNRVTDCTPFKSYLDRDITLYYSSLYNGHGTLILIPV